MVCYKLGSIWLLWLLFCLLLVNNAKSTHITGSFNTKDFFKFLIKFGFQNTDQERRKETYGYIFGNITAKTNFIHNITLAVLDRSQFLEYYGNRTIRGKETACAMMLKKINQSSYDMKCNDDGPQDYLR